MAGDRGGRNSGLGRQNRPSRFASFLVWLAPDAMPLSRASSGSEQVHRLRRGVRSPQRRRAPKGSQPVSARRAPGGRGVFRSYKKKDRIINKKGDTSGISAKQKKLRIMMWAMVLFRSASPMAASQVAGCKRVNASTAASQMREGGRSGKTRRHVAGRVFFSWEIEIGTRKRYERPSSQFEIYNTHPYCSTKC